MIFFKKLIEENLLENLTEKRKRDENLVENYKKEKVRLKFKKK